MLQQIVMRLDGLELGLNQLVCNQDNHFFAADQMRELGTVDILLEPAGRNTAPAVILAALRLQAVGREEPMLVLFADHDIADVLGFHVILT